MKNHEISSIPWNGNSKEVRGLKQKCPPSGGRGGEMEILCNYTMYFIVNCKSKHFEIFCGALDYIEGGHGFDSGTEQYSGSYITEKLK